jgi:hypothetical protein
LGTTVSRSSLALTGTFTAVAKYWQFTVLVTDSSGGAAAITPTFYVFPHLAFVTRSAICQGSYVAACKASLKYTLGTPSGIPKITIVKVGAYCPASYQPNCPPAPTGLPGGFAATVSGGMLTISVPANCGGTCPNGYTGGVTVILTDQSLCSAGAYCTSASATVDIWMITG